jgi:MFS family permease
LPGLSLLVLATVLASAGVATVIPQISHDLALRPAGSSWVLSIYTVGFAFAAAVYGQLADRWGVAVAIRLGVGLFAVGALIAGVAWAFPVLVLGRLVEGFGGGSVAILAQVLLTAHPDEDRRRRSLSGFTAIVTASSAAGPLMGGIVGEAADWRILTMLPALSVVVVPMLSAPAAAVQGPGQDHRERFDVLGAVTLLLAVGGLIFATRIPTLDANPARTATVVMWSFGATAALGVHVMRRPTGFVPLRLLRDRMFRTVCAVGAAVFGTYFSLLFAVPTLLGADRHWSALQVGLGLLPASCLGVAGSWLGGRARARRMARPVAVTACACAALGAAIPAVTEEPWSLILALGVASAALGTGYVLTLNAISQHVAAPLRGTALGLFNVCFYLAGAMASAVTGVLLQTTDNSYALFFIAAVALFGAAASCTWRSQR